MSTHSHGKATSLTDRKILRTATIDSFGKLDPRLMIKNPVMFVVEVGAVLTLLVLVLNVILHAHGFWFGLQITLWLWFMVLFAYFAAALEEVRGKATAELLRKARADTESRLDVWDGDV